MHSIKAMSKLFFSHFETNFCYVLVADLDVGHNGRMTRGGTQKKTLRPVVVAGGYRVFNKNKKRTQITKIVSQWV